MRPIVTDGVARSVGLSQWSALQERSDWVHMNTYRIMPMPVQVSL